MAVAMDIRQFLAERRMNAATDVTSFVEARRLVEAEMDPELAKLEQTKAAADKAYKEATKEWYRLSAVHSALDDLWRDVAYRERTPEQAWASALKGKRINKLFRDKSWPKYTKALAKKNLPIPTKEEVKKAWETYKDWDDKMVRPAGKAVTAATKAVSDHKKLQTKKRKAASDPAGHAVCQACWRAFSFDRRGDVVRHGWQEVGGRQKGIYGNVWHTGPCTGGGNPPFQVDKTIAEAHQKLVDGTYKALVALERSGIKTELEAKTTAQHSQAASVVAGAIAQMLPKSKQKDQGARDRIYLKALDFAMKGVKRDLDFINGMLRGWKVDTKWIKAAGYRRN